MIYYPLIFIHSWLRWGTIIMMLATLFISSKGLVNNSKFSQKVGNFFLIFRTVFGIQVMVGLILYFLVSPVTTWYLYHDVNHLMRRPQAFYTLFHPFGMFAAFLVCRAGEKKAFGSGQSKEKFRYWLTYTAFAFLIIMLTVPWPFYSVGRPWFKTW